MNRDLEPQEARQGRLGRPVLLVLLASLALGLAYVAYLSLVETDIAADEAAVENTAETGNPPAAPPPAQ